MRNHISYRDHEIFAVSIATLNLGMVKRPTIYGNIGRWLLMRSRFGPYASSPPQEKKLGTFEVSLL